MTSPDRDALAPYLRAPAADHALARLNRGPHRLLTCSAPGCPHTVDRGARSPDASERDHVAYVAALQLGALTGRLGTLLLDADALDALSAGSVVLGSDGRPRRRGPTGRWHALADPVGRLSSGFVRTGPVVVLSVGETDAPQGRRGAARAVP